jgi:hypothetical protein
VCTYALLYALLTRHCGGKAVVLLCSLDVDLSQQLQPRQRAEAKAADLAAGAQAPWQGRKEQQEAAAAAAARRPAQGAYPRMPPRRAEATRWERTNKSFTRRVRPSARPRTAAPCIRVACIITKTQQ